MLRALLLLTALLGLLLFLWPSQEASTAAPLEGSAPPLASGPELEPTADLIEVREEAPQDARVGWLVRVVDATGDPVPGATVLTTFVAGRIRKRVVHTAGPGVRTDASGEAFVPAPGDDLPAELLEDLAEGKAAARLALGGMLPEEAAAQSAAEVSLEAVTPPVRVTLVQPSTGSVVLTVRSPGGALPAGLVADLAPAGRRRTLGRPDALAVAAGEQETQVRVSGIGLGLELKAYLRAPWALTPLAQVELSGPTTPGETVEAALVLEALPTGVTLEGRAFGLAGGPLRIVALTPPQTGASEFLSPKDPVAVATLDLEEGEEFAVFAPWLKSPSERVFRSMQRIEAGNAPENSWQGVVEIEPGQQVVDLGVLHLGTPEVLVAGRVVDEAGNGVALDLNVVLDLTMEETAVVTWKRLHTETRSGEDGRFEVLGDYPDGNVSFELDSKEWVHVVRDDSIPLARTGARDAQLVVAAKGEVLLDPSGLPDGYRSHFTLVVERTDLPEDQAAWARQRRSLRDGPDLLRLTDLICGPSTARLEVAGAGAVASWEFVLRPDEPHDLGRPLLDRVLHTHTVVLETEEELSLERWPLAWGHADGKRVFADRSSRNRTRYTFLTAAPLDSITIQRPHGAGAHDEDGSVTVEVTGTETRVPWPPR